MWGDLDPWLASLWTSLLQLKPLPHGTLIDDSPRLERPLFTVTPVDTIADDQRVPGGAENASKLLEDEISRGKECFWDAMGPPRRDGHPGGAAKPARLLVNRRLTKEGHFQDVRHLEFDVSGVPGGGDYRAGDVAWVHPSNDSASVEAFAAIIGVKDLDQIVRIALAGSRPSSSVPDEALETPQQKVNPAPFLLPPACSVRVLLSDVLDILGTPRRSFFEKLSLFAADKEENEKLLELASPDGADLLYEYATREKRSYVEVMGDFQSCKVPMERLLELVPRLRPRGFSIASSVLETASRVHLCMAVVSFR